MCEVKPVIDLSVCPSSDEVLLVGPLTGGTGDRVGQSRCYCTLLLFDTVLKEESTEGLRTDLV